MKISNSVWHIFYLEIFSLIRIKIHFSLSFFFDFLNGSINCQHCPYSQQNRTSCHNDVHNGESQNGWDQSVHNRNCIDDQPKPKQTRNLLESSGQETKINDQISSGKAKAHLDHSVWKSQKKYHSTLRAKQATFTFWVDKSWFKMPKMVHFGEFLKTWSLRSKSVTRQASFYKSKIGGKCQKSKF